MMKYTYAYKTSDGTRHEASIEANSRDAAFELIRAQGIRPIKVVAADGSKANGEPAKMRLWPFAVLAAAVAVGIGVSFYVGRRSSGTVVITPDGTEIKTSVATPLARQRIPGDRQRIDRARNEFVFAAERALAQFVEPGRAFNPASLAADDWDAALKTPLKIASNEFSEVIDLKRIVVGMKRELAAYIAGGGTWNEYLAELAKRQKLEASYRENAERKVQESLSGSNADIAKAYDLWLKANAQLEAMGIYPIAIPDALRGYQLSADLEE